MKLWPFLWFRWSVVIKECIPTFFTLFFYSIAPPKTCIFVSASNHKDNRGYQSAMDNYLWSVDESFYELAERCAISFLANSTYLRSNTPVWSCATIANLLKRLIKTLEALFSVLPMCLGVNAIAPVSNCVSVSSWQTQDTPAQFTVHKEN